MDSTRIATLLRPFVEDSHDLHKNLLDNILTYIDLLLRWNERMNLTAIRDPEHIVTRHFGESLFAARHLFPPVLARSSSPGACMNEQAVREAACDTADAESRRVALQAGTRREEGGRAALQGRVKAQELKGALAPVRGAEKVTLADVGSGAGFPGVPIKLWAPHVHVTLIESNHKKATFLRELTRTLTLTDIDIQNSRAETLTKASFDVVTLRAVERFETILPIAASLVARRGRLAMMIGQSQLSRATRSLDEFDIQSNVEMPESELRHLVIASKSS